MIFLYFQKYNLIFNKFKEMILNFSLVKYELTTIEHENYSYKKYLPFLLKYILFGFYKIDFSSIQVSKSNL